MSGDVAGLCGGDKPNLDPIKHRKVFAREMLHQHELLEFCRFLLQSRTVSEGTYRLFLSLACQPPNIRLALNMRSFAKCVGLHELKSIRKDGVTAEEYKALDELDSEYVPDRLREVGHGLLGMHSRWLCAQALKRMICESHLNSKKFLGSISLDEVLGDK